MPDSKLGKDGVPFYEYGALNPVYVSDTEDVIDLSNNTEGIDILNKAIEKSYSVDARVGTSQYVGIVLRKNISKEEGVGGFFKGVLGLDEQPLDYSIYIPEIHAHLPRVTKYFESNEDSPDDPAHGIIDLYPRFIAENLDAVETPVGSPAIVYFKNNKTFEGPTYKRPVDKSPAPGPFGSSSPLSGYFQSLLGTGLPGEPRVPLSKIPPGVYAKLLSELSPAPPGFVDLRRTPRTKARGQANKVRKWEDITGITIHQTGGPNGDNPKQYINMPVQGAVTPGRENNPSKAILLHEPNIYMPHALNLLSNRDIGIEISAQAPGVVGDPSSLWLHKSKYKKYGLKGRRDPNKLKYAYDITEKQIPVTKKLIRYYVDLVAANGGKIKYIHAHRQAGPGRTSDTGEKIWTEIGRWATKTLGLSYGSDNSSNLFHPQDGAPLPDIWTGDNNGIPYI